MFGKDLYAILGLQRGASTDDIRAAYRNLARKYHPDVNKSDDAAERFNEIQGAYDVLSDDEKRRQYDQFGRVGGPAGVGAGAGGPQGGGAGYTEQDFADVFEQFFGGRGGGGSPFGAGPGRARSKPAPRRGADVEHRVQVSFMTAACGGTEQIRMSRDGQAETIEVRIPAGIEPGSKLRVRGRGGPSAGGAGDLILTVDVGDHPWFRRDGLDILIDVPVSLAEAALGATVTVPLLSGSVDLKVPAGSSSGRKLRVRGQGVTDASGSTGDLLAVVQIVAPESPTPRARELLGELADELKNPRESGPWAD